MEGLECHGFLLRNATRSQSSLKVFSLVQQSQVGSLGQSCRGSDLSISATGTTNDESGWTDSNCLSSITHFVWEFELFKLVDNGECSESCTKRLPLPVW